MFPQIHHWTWHIYWSELLYLFSLSPRTCGYCCRAVTYSNNSSTTLRSFLKAYKNSSSLFLPSSSLHFDIITRSYMSFSVLFSPSTQWSHLSNKMKENERNVHSNSIFMSFTFKNRKLCSQPWISLFSLLLIVCLNKV